MLMGFKWILDKQLAGSGRPGLYENPTTDMEFMRKEGIDTIVSLTETELEGDFLDEGFNVIHFPIPDMGIPLPRNAHNLCTMIKTRMDEGKSVLVHCKAGLGRTGTILACVLIEAGYTGEEAITEVRKNIRMAIQNTLQENFIIHYEQYKKNQEPKIVK